MVRFPSKSIEVPAMKLIVGLGNPGAKYRQTRHNIGFDVVSAFADQHFFPPARLRFDGLVTDHQVGSEKVILLQPQTYMNESGRSVRQCLDFFRIDSADVLVVLDDMNLDVGRLRLRPSGSAGGQKGLADIIRHTGSDAVPRVRFGIGRPPGRMSASDFVLHRFTEEERPLVDVATQKAVDGVKVWVADGIVAAMNQLNPADDDAGKKKRVGKKSESGGDSPEPSPSDATRD